MRTRLFFAVPMLCGSSLGRCARAQNDELFASYFVGGGNGGQAGVAVGDYSKVRKGPGFNGGFLEFGVIGPVRDIPAVGFFSVNYEGVVPMGRMLTILDRSTLPFLTAGYSRMFSTGNAINYGAGFVIRRDKMRTNGSLPAIKVEFRDYWVPGQGHSFGVRFWRQTDLCIDEC